MRTNHDPIEAGYVVNAAGLYTDKIAMGCGFSKHYRVLPFKGLYLYSNESPDLIRSNIYPVADLRNPFLGVHFTITAEDKTKIGQRRFLPHAGLPRHHSVPPLPKDWHHPLRLGTQVGKRHHAHRVSPTMLGIYGTILGQDRAPELPAGPLTERGIPSIPTSSPQSYPNAYPLR